MRLWPTLKRCGGLYVYAVSQAVGPEIMPTLMASANTLMAQPDNVAVRVSVGCEIIAGVLRCAALAMTPGDIVRSSVMVLGNRTRPTRDEGVLLLMCVTVLCSLTMPCFRSNLRT